MAVTDPKVKPDIMPSGMPIGVGKVCGWRVSVNRGRRARRVLCGLLVLSTVGGCTAVRDFRARRSVQRGEVLLASHDLQAALIEFQEAAALSPHMAVAHSRMGLIFRRLGEYGKAIDSFVEAVRRNPVSFDDVVQLAQLYHFTKRIKNAIQSYLRAVELDGRNFDAQLNLGACYQQVGDFTQAAQRFEKAIAIDPHRPQAYINLGVAFDAQKKYYGAIAAYKEALERDSRQPLVLVNLANTYMKQDRLKLAQHTLEEAVRIDSALAPAHEALGYCQFRRRDFEQAKESYATALQHDSRLPHAHSGLGSIFMLGFLKDSSKTGLRARAIEHWHRSLEIEPDQPRVRNLIAKYRPRYKAADPEELLLGTGDAATAFAGD